MSDIKNERGVFGVYFQTITAIIGILFSGNIYFVKRLVDTLDEHEKIIWGLKQDVTIMRVTLDDILKYRLKGK